MDSVYHYMENRQEWAYHYVYQYALRSFGGFLVIRDETKLIILVCSFTILPSLYRPRYDDFLHPLTGDVLTGFLKHISTLSGRSFLISISLDRHSIHIDIRLSSTATVRLLHVKRLLVWLTLLDVSKGEGYRERERARSVELTFICHQLMINSTSMYIAARGRTCTDVIYNACARRVCVLDI